MTHNTARSATTKNQYGSHSCLLASAIESSRISRGSRCPYALHHLIQARLKTGNVQSIIICYCGCTMSLHQSDPWEGSSCVFLANPRINWQECRDHAPRPHDGTNYVLKATVRVYKGWALLAGNAWHHASETEQRLLNYATPIDAFKQHSGWNSFIIVYTKLK